ncbi:hypothetical protein [Flavobacterium sp. Root420]|uniref:hypothetical protein n=1 Tax=Flavobacterium sp. Root420 TaxID=1736533 RepID=UPI0006F855FB|nr:hypothetical protein [Flavobacterium sp. Root420]KQW99027.1 hypothetical protein ASC72_12975 [Flavobacterium sp. Root420]
MEERKNWLDAAEKFRSNSNAVLLCPSCNEGYLQIRDVPFDENNISKGGERFIECPVCKKFEIILYRTIPENWFYNNKQN